MRKQHCDGRQSWWKFKKAGAVEVRVLGKEWTPPARGGAIERCAGGRTGLLQKVIELAMVALGQWRARDPPMQVSRCGGRRGVAGQAGTIEALEKRDGKSATGAAARCVAKEGAGRGGERWIAESGEYQWAVVVWAGAGWWYFSC